MKPIALVLCGVGGSGKSSVGDCLEEILNKLGHNAVLIRFDEFRKSMAPKGVDPFSSDPNIKALIYKRASVEFSRYMQEGRSLIIDAGLSNERIRREMIQNIKNLKVVHVYCPLFVAIYRDTMRSLKGHNHERGRYLHLRAIYDLVNPFKREKFPQPGITYPFEYPYCAHFHVNTFLRKPEIVAREICTNLGLI